MTPQILLNGLKHCFLKLDLIKVLIFDECHHARGNHPYACILTVSSLFLSFSLCAYACVSFIFLSDIMIHCD